MGFFIKIFTLLGRFFKWVRFLFSKAGPIAGFFAWLGPRLLKFDLIWEFVNLMARNPVIKLLIGGGLFGIIADLVLRRGAGMQSWGGAINNLLLSFFDFATSHVFQFSVKDMILGINSELLEMMGYLGVIEALNFMSFCMMQIVSVRMVFLVKVIYLKMSTKVISAV